MDRKPYLLVGKDAKGSPVVLATLSVRKSRAERDAAKLAPHYRGVTVALVRADSLDAIGH